MLRTTFYKILLAKQNKCSIMKVDQYTEYGQQIKNAHQLHRKPQPPIVKCALEKLKTLYVKITVLAGYYGYSKMVPNNYRMIYPVLRRNRVTIQAQP